MLKRIGLNFWKNRGWTLERLLLFMVLFFFLAVSILMRTLTNLVNDELIGASDLYVSVSAETDLDLFRSRSREEASKIMNDAAALYHDLRDELGVIYSDNPVTLRCLSQFCSFSTDYQPTSEDALPMGRSYFFQESTARQIRGHVQKAKNRASDQDELQLSLRGVDQEAFTFSSTLTLESMAVPELLRLHLGDVYLKEGRLPTTEELAEGEAVCVVGAHLGFFRNNEFFPAELGDKIPFSCYVLDENGETVRVQTREFTIIGVYEYAEADNMDMAELESASYTHAIYIPEQQLLDTYEWICDFQQAEYPQPAYPFFKQPETQSMIFQLDSVKAVENFIRHLEQTPAYAAGKLQYFANVDDTVNMLSEFYGVAESFRSVSAIFGVLAVAFAVTLAVLDAFYRRRELAILQSLGETGGRLTLQFSIETLILLVVSWIAAIPAAFYAVRAAIPGMLTQTAASENPFASLGGNIQMVSLDALTIQTHLRYSGGDLAFFGLFTLLTVAFCALAVWICTKRFHVRTLLNN